MNYIELFGICFIVMIIMKLLHIALFSWTVLLYPFVAVIISVVFIFIVCFVAYAYFYVVDLHNGDEGE